MTASGGPLPPRRPITAALRGAAIAFALAGFTRALTVAIATHTEPAVIRSGGLASIGPTSLGATVVGVALVAIAIVLGRRWIRQLAELPSVSAGRCGSAARRAASLPAGSPVGARPPPERDGLAALSTARDDRLAGDWLRFGHGSVERRQRLRRRRDRRHARSPPRGRHVRPVDRCGAGGELGSRPARRERGGPAVAVRHPDPHSPSWHPGGADRIAGGDHPLPGGDHCRGRRATGCPLSGAGRWRLPEGHGRARPSTSRGPPHDGGDLPRRCRPGRPARDAGRGGRWPGRSGSVGRRPVARLGGSGDPRSLRRRLLRPARRRWIRRPGLWQRRPGLPGDHEGRSDRPGSGVRRGLPGRARRRRGSASVRLDVAGGGRRRRDPDLTRARSDRALWRELRDATRSGLCGALSRASLRARPRWCDRPGNDRPPVLARERPRVPDHAGGPARRPARPTLAAGATSPAAIRRGHSTSSWRPLRARRSGSTTRPGSRSPA